MSAMVSEQRPLSESSTRPSEVLLHGDALQENISSNSVDEKANQNEAKKEELDLTLSALLREKTKKVHREAESVEFVHKFLRGKISQEVYCELLRRLHTVYSAMEEALRETCARKSEGGAFGLVQKTSFPKELERTKFIAQDLDYLTGSSDWRDKMISPVAGKYAERLWHLAKNDPLLLISHAYTRYLGDLSGGQTLMRVARKSMHLEDEMGTAFYVFPAVQDPKEFKNKFRQCLDDLNLSARDKNRVAEESIVAFRLNIEIFEEMDRLLSELGKNEEKEKRLTGCPFSSSETKTIATQGKTPNQARIFFSWHAATAAIALFCAAFLAFGFHHHEI